MDPSALIFVALAVAWAAYLVPLALRHHDDAARSRTVDGFSHRLRVLARREPVDATSARLVTPGKPAVSVEAAPATPAQLRARRAATARATKRRRTVLAVLLVANVAVVTVAAFALISWGYVAIPAGLLVAWLVACRVMVKGERAATARLRTGVPVAATPVEVPDAPAETEPEVVDEIDPMEDTSAGIAAIVDPAMWDPVPVTLPTYVSKPQATRRTVRTIDLDSTGVWTSGRTEADSQLAREADEADKAARQARRDGDDQRAVGS